MRSASVWRRISHAVFVTIAVVGSLPLQAQSGPPPTLTPAGAPPLTLVGHATRTHLAGVENLYNIALYGPAPFSPDIMVSEDVAKALRIEITYDRDWHRPPIV